MNTSLEQVIKQTKEELGLDDAQWEKVRNEVCEKLASQPKSRAFYDPIDKTFTFPHLLRPCSSKDGKVKKTYSVQLKRSGRIR